MRFVILMFSAVCTANSHDGSHYYPPTKINSKETWPLNRNKENANDALHCDDVSKAEFDDSGDYRVINRQRRTAYTKEIIIETKPLVTQLLSLAVTICHRTGKIIRKITEKGDLHIIDKGSHNYQTEADRSAQRCILASFKNKYPNINIIAEEADEQSKNLSIPNSWLVTEYAKKILNIKTPKKLRYIKEDQITIYVDPIDGTSDYTKGLMDHVTTLIGICVNSDPVAGVIYQPFWRNKGRAVWGMVGYGIGGLKLKFPPIDEYLHFITGKRSDKVVNRILDSMKSWVVVRKSGAGNKVLHLLEGKCHVYVSPHNWCNRWDTAGPEAVLRAAGGELTDIYGKNYNYCGKEIGKNIVNKDGVYASCPSLLHQDFLNMVHRAHGIGRYSRYKKVIRII